MNNNEARNEFENYLKRRYGDRSTPRHYMSDLKIFLETLNQKAYDQIDSRDVERFVEQQQKQGMSAATINRRMASMHTFFEIMAALEPEKAQANPVIWRLHGVKQGEPIPRDATDSEVTALFEQITDPRDQAMFGLMVGAGLRVGEVAALTMDALQPPSEIGGLAQLTVLGKGRKERVVWLTKQWYNKVVAYQAVRPESEAPYLFLNRRKQGISVNGIQHRLQGHCTQAGLSLTCHQLRHTFARRLANQRMPIESISKVLGHSQIETTQRYTAGADPVLQAEFEAAMTHLDAVDDDSSQTAVPPQPPRPARQHHPADRTELNNALARYASFPQWLRSELESHLTSRWHQWKPHMAASNAHGTSRQLVTAWQWLVQTFDLSGWDALRRTHIEAWMDHCLSRGLKAATVARSRSHLLAVLHFVQERDIAELHPQLFRVQPPSVPDALPRHLNDAEYKQLLKTVLDQTKNPHDLLHRTWFLTLAFTGIRLSELLNLRLADLDLTTGRLFIEESKNDKGRVTFLTPSLRQHLLHYLASRPASDSDHLFVNQHGLPLSPTSVRQRCRQWGKQCGVKVFPHCLRHTFATRLINQGVSLESIRRLLGHRTLRMTQQYARLHQSTVRQHFEEATAHLEGILIQDWPHQDEHYVNVTPETLVNSM